MSDNDWEDYRSKADYSCDPYTYYFLWSNFGSRDYHLDLDFNDECSSGSRSGFSLTIGFLILVLLTLFGL
ncbi:hypothetical protein PCC7424_1124 [Gloeothece citriformis PCC 7424]|uniref:Uncharacterized protein n=1 Tax=Gloeothece citriformis (strain PCC 7424) TaxID=65393 RepID=B7KJX6_GLOC7|nr:hypothetical protein [Gloeothece citriformis]ACK69575.1 hypothetical protein PCC7424_1124 [Gloeothece citriformis PCC 7424]